MQAPPFSRRPSAVASSARRLRQLTVRKAVLFPLCKHVQHRHDELVQLLLTNGLACRERMAYGRRVAGVFQHTTEPDSIEALGR